MPSIALLISHKGVRLMFLGLIVMLAVIGKVGSQRTLWRDLVMIMSSLSNSESYFYSYHSDPSDEKLILCTYVPLNRLPSSWTINCILISKSQPLVPFVYFMKAFSFLYTSYKYFFMMLIKSRDRMSSSHTSQPPSVLSPFFTGRCPAVSGDSGPIRGQLWAVTLGLRCHKPCSVPSEV